MFLLLGCSDAIRTGGERVPMQKRGPRAWENARRFDQFSQATSQRQLRLHVHHVNDATNDEYVKDVDAFLCHIIKLRLPFRTLDEKDNTMVF